MNEQNVTAAIADDDWLDRALADAGREHRAAYLDDDGFTARVAAALPAPATLPAWRKPASRCCGRPRRRASRSRCPARSIVGYDAMRLLASRPVTLGNILTGMVALGVATWAAAAIALRRND